MAFEIDLNKGAGPGAQPVVEVTTESFEREVLRRSVQTPVLLDLWATWCEPCRTLGPVLERLAQEMDGAFVLAKVDIDRNPDIAQALRVQSVPMVMLFIDGQPVDVFQGAQPEHQVRAFLERHLSDPADLEVARARETAEAGDPDSAIRILRGLLRPRPDHAGARILLAEILTDAGREVDARAALDRLDLAAAESPEARAIRARLDFASKAGDLAKLRSRSEKRPDDLDARLDLGRALVAAHRYEEGLEELLEVFRRDRDHGDQAARKVIVEVFDLLGPEDPRTVTYRRRLSSLLFA